MTLILQVRVKYVTSNSILLVNTSSNIWHKKQVFPKGNFYDMLIYLCECPWMIYSYPEFFPQNVCVWTKCESLYTLRNISFIIFLLNFKIYFTYQFPHPALFPSPPPMPYPIHISERGRSPMEVNKAWLIKLRQDHDFPPNQGWVRHPTIGNRGTLVYNLPKLSTLMVSLLLMRWFMPVLNLLTINGLLIPRR